jgi:NAD(P)-dependent dehydrogenase (short-subunit alcohol dehydrogenase family)
MSKVWLVTGSGRGLGRDIVKAALAAGDRVVAKGRDLRQLADLREQRLSQYLPEFPAS